MIRILLFTTLILLCGKTVTAQSYAAILISDSLKKNANAVLRDEVYTYIYQSPEKNITRHRKVITVLNKNGDEHAVFRVNYNKFISVESMRGVIYNEIGLPLRKIKASEISDNSGSAGYALFDDIRYKYFNPLISTYPYTVEYEYEIVSSGSYYFPDFLFFEGHNVSIEHSEFRVIVPRDYKLQWKQFNNCGDPAITTTDDQVTYEWKAAGIIAIDEEPYEENLIRQVQAIYTAPSAFSFGGYEGRMDSWNDYAKWINTLNAGRDILPENRQIEIRQLVADAQDDRTKIRILYKYLQQRTRYFNISLGIGGLQPADATTVDQVGYGDCKGLSNYMKALLKAVGINSYYTIVEAGGDFPEIITDFPKHQFNHAMLCIPLQKDTVWLECTSQVIPFGFLGDFTSDRQVLLIKESGGELVRTPAYPLEQNFQNTRARVLLSADGNGKADIKRTFGGLQFDDHIIVMHSNNEDQRDWLYDYIELPAFQLDSYNFRAEPDEKPLSFLSAAIGLSGYASSSGKRLFLPLNLVNRMDFVPSKVKERRTDIRRTYPYIDADTIEYVIPDGMDTEYLPDANEIKSPFGEYRSYTERIDNKIFYYRQVKMFKGTFPKELYNDFVKFYYDISVADKCQAILIKKET